jgi:hypothetical protein
VLQKKNNYKFVNFFLIDQKILNMTYFYTLVFFCKFFTFCVDYFLILEIRFCITIINILLLYYKYIILWVYNTAVVYWKLNLLRGYNNTWLNIYFIFKYYFCWYYWIPFLTVFNYRKNITLVLSLKYRYRSTIHLFLYLTREKSMIIIFIFNVVINII